MTRRIFFQTLSAAILVSAGRRARAGSISRADVDADPWTRARDIVESGALGAVIWGQVSVPAGAAPVDREVGRLLNAMGIVDSPRRVSRLEVAGAIPAGQGATTIVEFESGPPVYVAAGPGEETMIRGTRARLHVRGSRLRLLPNG